MGTELKVILAIVCVAIAGLGGFAVWQNRQQMQRSDAVDREIQLKAAAEQALWRQQLEALARFRPALAQLDALYPKVGEKTRCTEAVGGPAPIVDRRHLRDLIQNEPAKDVALRPWYASSASDFKEMAAQVYWVVYTIEGQVDTKVYDDASNVSIEPGSSSGSVVVFEAKTARVACQAQVSSRGSERITIYTRDREPTSARLQKAREAARLDLDTNFRQAVGDALQIIAPGLQRPYGFYR